MKKINITFLITATLLSSFAISNDVILNAEMIDKKMDEFSTLSDYYNAQEKMFIAKDRAMQAKDGESTKENKEESNEEYYKNKLSSNLLGRDMRGKAIYDRNENEDVNKVKPVAYVASTYGGSDLSAEIQWGTMSFIVQEGDPIIGGSWFVKEISKGSVILQNDKKVNLLLSGAPVDISELLGASN
jgi:hypothetical protein